MPQILCVDSDPEISMYKGFGFWLLQVEALAAGGALGKLPQKITGCF